MKNYADNNMDRASAAPAYRPVFCNLWPVFTIIFNMKYKKTVKSLARHLLSVSYTLFISAVLLLGCRGGKKAPVYEFTSITRGTLEKTVSSTGTLNPVATVNVLPRMSGKVEKIYVDYNDPVRAGDTLAELNTDMLRLKSEQQNASVTKAQTNYELQLLNYQNQAALAEKNLISEYELKANKAQLDGFAADLAVARSNLKVTQTEINQYAFITSPIDGIVLDRRINVGDTVVDSSSNNSSTIFTLAENLKEMQIEVMVGELDVASIHKGQAVRFTLESLPGRRFSGEVETLRLVPVVSNSVVSYTVIVKVENQGGFLLPGMTCMVDFIVERSETVLMIPNAALRYQPTSLSSEQISEMVFNASLANMSDERRQAAIEARGQAAQAAAQTARQNANTGITGLITGGIQSSGRSNSRPASGSGSGQGRRSDVVMRNFWYLGDDGKLDVMQVETGITNGSSTEIRAKEDLEGRQVILRERI